MSLRARQPIDDAAFEQIYGAHVRRMSAVPWTPERFGDAVAPGFAAALA